MQHPFFLISKKQLCTRFLSTWNFQKLPSYTFYGRNVVCVPSCSLFSLPLIITIVAASISPFSHCRYKKFFCFGFVSLALAFFVIHVNVDIEMKSKERIGICCCCFISKKPGSYAITVETSGCLKCKISSRLTWRRGRTYGRSPWKHRLPNFLTHGAPLRAFLARELRYKNFMRK